MRGIAFGAVLALSLASTAVAADFIVVSSNQPEIRIGQALQAGSRAQVEAGHSVMLMRPSGEVITLKGAPGGAVLPAVTAKTDDAKFAGVQALFARPPSGRTFGARRGLCPGPEILDNIPAMVRANQSGCKSDARSALQDFLKSQGVTAADVDKLYAETSVGEETQAASALGAH